MLNIGDRADIDLSSGCVDIESVVLGDGFLITWSSNEMFPIQWVYLYKMLCVGIMGWVIWFAGHSGKGTLVYTVWLLK